MDIDECLLKLRQSLNNTIRNVVYEDNNRVARILQSYVTLKTDVDLDFEKYMRMYIGHMTFETTRAFSAPLSWLIGNETKNLQTVFSPMSLSQAREIQFDFLFDSTKFLFETEIQVVLNAIEAKPESESCWSGVKVVMCEIIGDVGKKVEEIFRVDARDSKKDYEIIERSIEQLSKMIEGNYGHKCVNEDYREEMKRCVWESVSLRVEK